MDIARIGGTVALGLALMLPPVAATGQDAPDTGRAGGSIVALTHATVIDGTGAPARPDQTIVLQRDTIAAIFPTAGSSPPVGADVVDLTGRFIIPGLIDTHVHLATDPSDGDRRPAVERRLRNALHGGVTSVRDMAGDGRALADLSRPPWWATSSHPRSTTRP